MRVFRTFRFIDKNPEIDVTRTAAQDEGLYERLGTLALLSGLSKSTLVSWYHGDTRDPRSSSIMAVMTSLGYEKTWRRKTKIDLETELEAARKWADAQERKSKRRNGKGRAR